MTRITLAAIVGVGLFGLPSIARETSNPYNLSSRVENIHHGMKEGKYAVDGKLYIKNNGANPVENRSFSYSVCFSNKPGHPNACISGNGGLIKKLDPGQEFSRDMHLKGGNDPTIYVGKSVHIDVNVYDEEREPIYSKGHEIGQIGDYK